MHAFLIKDSMLLERSVLWSVSTIVRKSIDGLNFFSPSLERRYFLRKKNYETPLYFRTRLRFLFVQNVVVILSNSNLDDLLHFRLSYIWTTSFKCVSFAFSHVMLLLIKICMDYTMNGSETVPIDLLMIFGLWEHWLD